jgi:hypothetical protein
LFFVLRLDFLLADAHHGRTDEPIMEFVAFGEDLNDLAIFFAFFDIDRVHEALSKGIANLRENFAHAFGEERVLDLVVEVLEALLIRFGFGVFRRAWSAI